MMNVLLGVLTFYILLSGFLFSYRLSGINRTFLLLPKGIIENAIVIIYEQNYKKPFFNQEYLEKETEKYFSVNLEKYVSSFALSFYYFDKDGNEDYFDQRFDGVSIALKTPLFVDNYYQNSLTFTIQSHV